MIAENVTTATGTDAGSVDKQSPPKKISAYYSLVFPSFTFYIQTLSVTIGRRCSTNANGATSSTPVTEASQVDVDLGALKSVSRLHAKIEYDSEQDRFVLAVIGRNGAWVDGVWSGSGTRAPLGERSQIQIASRTFEFVLPPPPPPPDDSPSPSSHSSSANRQRSPSLDITSFSPPSSQPSHSPPPPEDIKPPKLVLPSPPRPGKRPLPPPEPQLPNSNNINRATKGKKRRKSDSTDLPSTAAEPLVEEKPPPDQIPPKPTFTYAQLIYRSLKVLNKATLNEICNWIMTEFPYYRYADGPPWTSSVRHNLSSNKAFKKLEKCGSDRGKGYFWSLDEQNAHIIEEQELKSQQQAAQAAAKGKKKDKGAPLSDPPLKRSVKGDSKVLPPPLTSTPLTSKAAMPSTQAPKTTVTSATSSTLPASGTNVFPSQQAYQSTTNTSGYSSTPMSGPNPYTALTQSNWRIHSKLAPIPVVPSTTTPTAVAPIVSPPAVATPTVSAPQASPPSNNTTVSAASASPAFPDVPIPIILGPIPPTHPDYSPSHPNNSAREGYMVLHERKLVLDPNVFSDLTAEIIADLERMGSRQALDVLTGHMVRVLKERRRAKKKGAARGRGAKAAGGVKRKEPGDSTPVSGPGPVPLTATANDEDTIVIIDDSDAEPAAKKRKVDELPMQTPPPAVVAMS